MKKNTKLTIILVALIATSILISLTGKKENSKSFDTELFAVKDTALIESVTIQSARTIGLTRNGSGWTLNDNLKPDPSRVEVLKSILALVKVRRPVARLNQEDVVRELQGAGRRVTVNFSNGSEFTFVAGGDVSKKKSYYLDENTAYIVEIPGYDNYISGIFELTENQWRDRLIFSSTWRSLQSLDIDYVNENENLNIYFDKKFLTVKGVNKLDTTALMDYIGQYQFFQINDFLDKGKYPRYDSLLATEPIVKLTIKDIDQSKNKELQIFQQIRGERFHLLSDGTSEMMVIDSKRMSNLLSKKGQFISK